MGQMGNPPGRKRAVFFSSPRASPPQVSVLPSSGSDPVPLPFRWLSSRHGGQSLTRRKLFVLGPCLASLLELIPSSQAGLPLSLALQPQSPHPTHTALGEAAPTPISAGRRQTGLQQLWALGAPISPEVPVAPTPPRLSPALVSHTALFPACGAADSVRAEGPLGDTSTPSSIYLGCSHQNCHPAPPRNHPQGISSLPLLAWSLTLSSDRDHFQLGSLSHLLNAKATGYQELPDWPEEAPDPSVRNVEVSRSGVGRGVLREVDSMEPWGCARPS